MKAFGTVQVSKTAVLVAWLAILGTRIVWAQSGTFTPTGYMGTPRIGHTATLLRNGKVLVVGDKIGSAELYDPLTGTFAPTGYTVSRGWHTATLLADGKVLIASRSQADVSAEIYNPSTGTFSPTGNLTTPRNDPTATLLADGRVLIAGGWVHFAGQPVTPLASAELFDPSTGVFTATGDIISPSWLGSHTGTLLPDGKVLLQGSPAELYDPVTGAFSLTGAMTWPFHYTATLLLDGRVLFAGGDDDPGEYAGAEVYDPATGLFTDTGDMTAPRADHTATLLPDGTVLIAGSNGDGGKTLTSAELYDPVTGTFSATGDMSTDRGAQTATLLNNGKVLIAGGVHTISPYPAGVWAALYSAELYNPPSLAPAPVLYSLSGDRQGQGAILHAGTAQLASASSPAIAGGALEIYCTGLVDGSVIPPQVAIGGRMAEILFFGKAPGFASLNQVNVRVPSGVKPGPAVPVRLTYLGRASNEVTIGVK